MDKIFDKTYWTETNVAWLAGLVEGEGCIAKSKAFLRIRMTDADVIQKCLLFGIGHMRGPVEGNTAKGHRPMYEWTVTKRSHFTELIDAIRPYLGERRNERIAVCFRNLEENRRAVQERRVKRNKRRSVLCKASFNSMDVMGH